MILAGLLLLPEAEVEKLELGEESALFEWEGGEVGDAEATALALPRSAVALMRGDADWGAVALTELFGERLESAVGALVRENEEEALSAWLLLLLTVAVGKELQLGLAE